MTTFQGKHKVASVLDPISVDSDGVTGNYVDYNGYSRAFFVLGGGLVSGGDSDDTLTLTVSKSAVAAATAAASDETVITAAAVTLGPSADTDTALGLEFIDLDLVAHGLTTGSLIVNALASEGGTAIGYADIVLYNKSGVTSDTSMTITVPASS